MTCTYCLVGTVRGHHIYNNVWTPLAGKQLALKHEEDNTNDHRLVAVIKSDDVVGHLITMRDCSNGVDHAGGQAPALHSGEPMNWLHVSQQAHGKLFSSSRHRLTCDMLAHVHCLRVYVTVMYHNYIQVLLLCFY